MGTVYLDRLLDERTSLTGIMENLRDRAAAEERDVTDSERSEITRLQERCAEIDGLLAEHHAQAESARNFAQLQAKIEAGRAAVPEQRGPARAVEYTSPGQSFVDSEEFRSYPGRGQSRPFEIVDFLPLEQRALITTSTLAVPHALVAPKQVDTPIPGLLQVVDVVRVSAGVVDWVVVSGNPVAAVVAEGAAKPEATVTFTPQSASLDTIAHWVQITRQALEDASYIRSVLEGKLRRGLLLKIAADMDAALDAATLPTATVTAASGAGVLGAIRVGIGTVEAAGHNPNAVVLNPADYAALDMAVMAATVNGPTMGASFWGLRAISSAAQTAGTALVGDFQAGATYFDRGATNVFLSDSHSDFFIKNILVILAEARGKSVVTDVSAFCECSVAP